MSPAPAFAIPISPSASASVDFVNGATQFGLDPTGTLADNSTAMNNALASLEGTGLGLFLPAGVYKFQNPITAGNGSASQLSTTQGPIIKGAGKPSQNFAQSASSLARGLTQLVWNGSAGGTLFQMLGPLQGWELKNLYFYAGASNPAGTGVRLYSVQFGHMEDCVFDGFTGGGYTASIVVGGALLIDTVTAGAFNSMHNKYRNIAINVPASASGIQLGPVNNSSSNACYEKFENITIVPAAGTSGSALTFCIQAARCDTIEMDDVHLIGAGGGVNISTIMWFVFASQGFPDNVVVRNCDFNPGGAHSHGMTVPNAFSASSFVYIENPAHDNGITYPPFGVGNIIWNDPMTVFPQAAFTQPTITSGTAWKNNLCIPVMVTVAGGTISSNTLVNGTTTGLTTGSFFLKPNDTITISWSVAPTITVFAQ